MLNGGNFLAPADRSAKYSEQNNIKSFVMVMVSVSKKDNYFNPSS